MKSKSMCLGLLLWVATLAIAQKPVNTPQSNANSTQEKESIAQAAPVTTENLTLQRARDYHFVSGNIGCPDCKDMYCSTLRPAAAGAKIVSIETVAQRPTRNNHWYRCQAAVSCGRPEFSDPNDARLDCIGKTSCNICRATDDGVGNYEDDIRMKYQ
ncbi:MAG TPA: hypothetical protein VN922_13795 [Bacteroidia bacterium]|nr:hypothetical protein [Bacteroidia bacterium]